jgi:hypothetical protein
MLGSRQTANRQERLQWWRRQIARQQSANRSVAEFSHQLGVSVATFYYWKRRVASASLGPSGQVPAQHPSPARNGSDATTRPSFVPVSIVEPTADTQLEVELANACVVRLKGAIDPSLLQIAITAAGELHGSRRGAK